MKVSESTSIDIQIVLFLLLQNPSKTEQQIQNESDEDDGC